MTMWFKPLLSRTGTVTRKGEAARASESRLAEEGNFPSLPPPPVPLSTHWADDIRDVGDGGARGSPEVEDLGPRLDVCKSMSITLDIISLINVSPVIPYFHSP